MQRVLARIDANGASNYGICIPDMAMLLVLLSPTDSESR